MIFYKFGVSCVPYIRAMGVPKAGVRDQGSAKKCSCDYGNIKIMVVGGMFWIWSSFGGGFCKEV
jgi:hypothetical protein